MWGYIHTAKKLHIQGNNFSCLDIMALLLLWKRHPTDLLGKVSKKKLQCQSFSPAPWEPAEIQLEEITKVSLQCLLWTRGGSWFMHQQFCTAADQVAVQENIWSGFHLAWASASACSAPPCLLLYRHWSHQHAGNAGKAGKGRGGSTKAKWK